MHEYFLPWILPYQLEEVRHIRVLRSHTEPRYFHETHAEVGHFLALVFAARQAQVHDDSDAHLCECLEPLFGRLRAAIQIWCDFSEIRQTLEMHPLRHGMPDLEL